ncbi:MAG: hypothetical protein FWG60_03080 [Methanomassiliicoccaceae archaeon]|nr:hypothetical protein [Methanomassiliicoccaceae archaeon]
MAASNDKPAVEYTAQAASPLVNGEVKLKVKENSFIAAGLFDVAEIPYSRVNALEFENYNITARTDDGDYTFSRMGSWATPFFEALRDAYNKAVLRAFFVRGNPMFTATGDYRFTENGVTVNNGKAPIHVYDTCVVALPPNSNARRIPLCFVTGMDKKDVEVTLTLNNGDSYAFSKLGYETAGFAERVENNIRALREKTIEAVTEIDPTLTASQASQVSKLLTEGVAAPMGQLAAISSSFSAAVDKKLAQTRAADSYRTLKEMCDPSQIWVGLKKNDIRQDGGDGPDGPLVEPDAPEESMPVDEGGAADAAPDPYLFWMIAPSPDGQHTAVEFAVKPGESAATFVYRTGGNVLVSASHLNRALEAISFKREVIRLTEEELLKPENIDYFMAAKRTASLKYVRANFVARVIHSSPEAWKRKLTELWNKGAAQSVRPAQPTTAPSGESCPACGMALTQGMKFCGGCGAKIDQK